MIGRDKTGLRHSVFVGCAVVFYCLFAVAPTLGASEGATAKVVADTGENITIHFDVGDYTLSPVDIQGTTYSQIALGTESLMMEAGSPALPHVCRSVIIPNDAAMDVRVVEARYHDVQGVEIAPSKGNLSRAVDPRQVPYTFGAPYSTNAFWPAQLATLRDPYILRDFRGVTVVVNPLQFNPVTRTLRVYTDITVEVYKTGLSRVNVLAQQRPEASLAFHQLYQHHFLNYAPGLRYTPLDESGDMLIICYDPWLANVQPLVDHKIARGISTTAVGVSTIGNNSTAIKSYIQSLYNTTNLSFVLLVGDAAQVAPPISYSGAADPLYAMLAGGDNYPEIMVGRFSAENAAQVDTQVLRTIEYETMPATSQDWFMRGVGIASAEGAGIGDDGESDQQHQENIRADLLAYGFTVIDQIYDAWGASASQVTSAVNAGRGMINYTGHGSITAWGTTGFSVSNVNALVNDNMLPVVCSVACNNGEFDGYTTCFAEAWLRATNGSEPTGAIGFYGSSVLQDWAPPMDAQDEFVDMFVSEQYSAMGTLLFAGCCHMLDEYGSDGTKTMHTWILFGDPSVQLVYTGPFPPVAEDVSVSTPVDVPRQFNLNATDDGEPNPPATLDLIVTSLPSHGTLADPNAGAIDTVPYMLASHGVQVNYTPAPGYWGTDAFGYKANDGGAAPDGGDSNVATVSITVGGPAWDPVANDMSIATAVSFATDITLSATDPNGDPLVYTIEMLPVQGSLIDPAGGEITAVPYELIGGGNVVVYQPPCRQVLVDAFDFSARDATCSSPAATVDIAVTASDPRRVYSFPLDTDPGWTTQGQWAFGQPSGGGSHNLDPTTGYTGSNVYGYNLLGDYSQNMPVYALTTTAIDCSQLTGTQLRFYRWLGVERYDTASVELSTDGNTWTPVWANPSSVSIADLAWTPVQLDISSLADGESTVYIRWQMGPTDRSVSYPGWNIDDVEIWGVVPIIASDFNGDGQLNVDDWNLLESCFAGPDGDVVTGCTCMDLDEDGDVDLLDFAAFQDEFVE